MKKNVCHYHAYRTDHQRDKRDIHFLPRHHHTHKRAVPSMCTFKLLCLYEVFYLIGYLAVTFHRRVAGFFVDVVQLDARHVIVAANS